MRSLTFVTRPSNSAVSTRPSPDTVAVRGTTWKSGGGVNADSGTICFGSPAPDQRRNMLAPPVSWNISSRKSYCRPEVSDTGALVCSRSQSPTQWSITGLPSMNNRKPLSPMA